MVNEVSVEYTLILKPYHQVKMGITGQYSSILEATELLSHMVAESFPFWARSMTSQQRQVAKNSPETDKEFKRFLMSYE